MANPEPIPTDPWVRPSKWTLSDKAFDWLLNLSTVISRCATRLGSVVTFTAQVASIGLTAMAGTASGGRFRVTVTLYIEQAATTSSSVTVTLSFVRNGIARTATTTAIVNGTATTSWTQVFLLDSDAGLSYSATYASVGATPMKFGGTVLTEAIG